jgi:hypothetical protein
MSTGLYTDDFAWWLFPGDLKHTGYKTVWSYMMDHYGLVAGGRLYPFAYPILGYFWVLMSSNVFFAKLFVFAELFLSYLAMAYLLTIVFKPNKTVGLLFLIISPIFFQIRAYYDPVVCILPWVVTSLLLTVLHGLTLALSLSAKSQFIRSTNLIVSIFLFVICLLLSELGFIVPFVTFFIILAMSDSFKNFLLKLAPFLIISIVFVSAYIYFHNSSNDLGSSELGSIDGFFRALPKNLWAGFPISYMLSDPQNIFSDYLNIQNKRIYITVLVSVFVFILNWFAWLKVAFKYQQQNESKAVLSILGLGGVFFVIPAAMVSASGKYQLWINSYGLSYLPVIFQYIGITLIFSVLLAYACQKFKSVKNYILTLIFLLLLPLSALSIYANLISSSSVNIAATESTRQNIVDLMKLGFFDRIENNSVIFVDHQWPWFRATIFNQYLDREILIQETSGDTLIAIKSWMNNHPTQKDLMWRLRFIPVDYDCSEFHRQCGFFALTRIKGFVTDKHGGAIKLIESDPVVIGFRPPEDILNYWWYLYTDKPFHPERFSREPVISSSDMSGLAQNVFYMHVDKISKNKISLFQWSREGDFVGMNIFNKVDQPFSDTSMQLGSHTNSASDLNNIEIMHWNKLLPNRLGFASAVKVSSNIYTFGDSDNSIIGLDGLHDRFVNGMPTSILFKIRPDKNFEAGSIISNSADSRGFSIEKSEATKKYFISFGDGAKLLLSPYFDLPVNEWSSILVTSKSNYIKVSISTKNQKIITFSTDKMALPNREIFIGNSSKPRWKTVFRGQISNLSYLNRVITSEEIQNFFNSYNR